MVSSGTQSNMKQNEDIQNHSLMTSMYKTEIHSTFTITTFQTKSENYQKMFLKCLWEKCTKIQTILQASHL